MNSRQSMKKLKMKIYYHNHLNPFDNDSKDQRCKSKLEFAFAFVLPWKFTLNVQHIQRALDLTLCDLCIEMPSAYHFENLQFRKKKKKWNDMATVTVPLNRFAFKSFSVYWKQAQISETIISIRCVAFTWPNAAM